MEYVFGTFHIGDPSFLDNSSLQYSFFSCKEIADYYYIAKLNLKIRIHRDITGEM